MKSHRDDVRRGNEVALPCVGIVRSAILMAHPERSEAAGLVLRASPRTAATSEHNGPQSVVLVPPATLLLADLRSAIALVIEHSRSLREPDEMREADQIVDRERRYLAAKALLGRVGVSVATEGAP